jgi:hypothetical protein
MKPGTLVEHAAAKPEAVRRARFQNLIWRDARVRSVRVVVGLSGGPKPPEPDVPVEWLRELDHH